MLRRIVNDKLEELALTKTRQPLNEVKARAVDAPPVRCLLQCLGSAPEEYMPIYKIIAEIKKASPSRGVIKEDMNHCDIAAQYQECGAAAISVLTERKYFGGEPEHIQSIRETCGIPILRKDFIFDMYQLYEARAWGADSVLLIAAILDVEQIVDLFFEATELGMHPLIEIHDEEDMEKALAVPCRLLGINNRDLKTFKTDITNTLRLINHVPDDRLVVSESGIKSLDDLKELSAAGVRGFLIGELFMAEERPGDKLRELLGLQRPASGEK